jgi:hypothetical protein
METKAGQVRAAIKAGDRKTALKIAAGFPTGMSKEDKKAITIAYECIVHPDFYRGMGYDLAAAEEKGWQTLLVQKFVTWEAK